MKTFTPIIIIKRKSRLVLSMQDPAVAEALSLIAAAQLVAEEEQAASKAAAKKAKKLRQKQAKQPQAQVSATETSSADRMNPESNSALPFHGNTDSDPVPAESAKELSVQPSMSWLQIQSATTGSCCSQSQQFLQTKLDGMVQPDRLSSALPVSSQDTRPAVSAAQSQCTTHVHSEPDEACLEQPSGMSASPQAAAATSAKQCQVRSKVQMLSSCKTCSAVPSPRWVIKASQPRPSVFHWRLSNVYLNQQPCACGCIALCATTACLLQFCIC